jgi:hypothetical protein
MTAISSDGYREALRRSELSIRGGFAGARRVSLMETMLICNAAFRHEAADASPGDRPFWLPFFDYKTRLCE